MASRQDGVTQLYDLPQGGGPERLPQPEKTKDKVLLDERGLLDLPFLALTVLLVLIGVIMVFSASYARAYYLTGNSTYYFARQAIFAVAGIAGMLFVSRLNYQLWRSASFIILLVSVFFLMLVPIIGSTANGAKRWIEVAGIRFQPSELAKIAIIMTFSALISTYRDKMRTFRYGILPFAVIMVVLCGLVALERHFSGVLIMLLLPAAMLLPAPPSACSPSSISNRRAMPAAASPPGVTRPPTQRTTATRSFSRSTPSAPAASWALVSARADRNICTCPRSTTTIFSPSSVRSWALSARSS